MCKLVLSLIIYNKKKIITLLKYTYIKYSYNKYTKRQNTKYMSTINQKLSQLNNSSQVCICCNKQQKNCTLIKLTTTVTSKFEFPNLVNFDKINIICETCFDKNNFVSLTSDMVDKIIADLEFSLKIFLSSKHLFVDKKEWTKYFKSKTLSNQKTERKQNLVEKLMSYKLSYDRYAKNKICESYVNSGNPDLDTVIKSLYSKQSEEDDRLCILLEKLKLLNLEYDSKVPSYKKFITKGGDINLIVESAELEKDLMENTNYLLFCDLTDSDTAKEIAVAKIEKKTKVLEKYIAKKNTIRFD